MTREEDIQKLRLIAAGNALSAADENDLEERGLIVQTHEPYASLTPKGRELLGAEPGTALTEAQVRRLFTRGLIDRATFNNALRAFRGDRGHVGQHALKTCTVAIEALVERAVDAACAAIQDRLGVKTGDLAAAVLSDGTIERELTRYVHAELAIVPSEGEGDETAAEPA